VSINSQTPVKKFWQLIRRISGKPTPAAKSHLKINNTTIEQPNEIANIIASTIAHNSSSDHYTDSFQRLKSRQEKQEIKFPSDNSESNNLPFSKTELTSAIRKAHDSATGPDNVHYQMLKTCQKLLWIHYYVSSTICGLQVISHHPGQKPPSY